MRARLAALSVIAIFCCSAVVACAEQIPKPGERQTQTPTPKQTQTGTEMTPDESRDSVKNLFDDTQIFAGGVWSNFDDGTPYNCDQANGLTGVQYMITRFGSSPGTEEDARSVVDRVAVFWEGRGYVLHRYASADGIYEVSGRNEHNGAITFGANFRVMTLGSDSNCVPGSSDDIIDEMMSNPPKAWKNVGEDPRLPVQ